LICNLRLEDEDHDPTDIHVALGKAYLWGDEIPLGLFWRRTDLPTLEQSEPVLQKGGPLAYRHLGISEEGARDLKRESL